MKYLFTLIAILILSPVAVLPTLVLAEEPVTSQKLLEQSYETERNYWNNREDMSFKDRNDKMLKAYDDRFGGTSTMRIRPIDFRYYFLLSFLLFLTPIYGIFLRRRFKSRLVAFKNENNIDPEGLLIGNDGAIAFNSRTVKILRIVGGLKIYPFDRLERYSCKPHNPLGLWSAIQLQLFFTNEASVNRNPQDNNTNTQKIVLNFKRNMGSNLEKLTSHIDSIINTRKPVKKRDSEKYKNCPFCTETILYEAIKCKHCRSNLEDNDEHTIK